MAELGGWTPRRQVILHWTVVVLVIVQLVLGGAMSETWEARLEGEAVGVPFGALAHVVVGVSILLLMLYRLYLRLTLGHPGRPERQPQWASTLGAATHYALYALLIIMPLSGATGWFFGVELAARAHAGLLRFALIALIVLHIVGGLAEHFVFRSPVLQRMLRLRG